MITPKDKNMIVACMRRIFSRSSRAWAARNAALSKKTGPRGGKMYTCAACKKPFGQKKINVDHIDPMIPIGTTVHDMSWDEIINRLWCDEDNLQVLCTTCHTEKTNKEKGERARARKEQKDG